MNKKPIIFILQLFLVFQIVLSEDDKCTTELQKSFKEECEYLSTGDTQCIIYKNECRDWFKGCSDYAPTEDFDEELCKAIKPLGLMKKCVVITAVDSKKSCVEEYKTDCSDFTDKSCFDLDLHSDEKRCVYLNGKCEEHSNLCERFNDEAQCVNNIPNQKDKKCVWDKDFSKCLTEERRCADYKVYEEKNVKSLECSSLKGSSEKSVCHLNGDNCEEVYPKCEDIQDKTTCEQNILYIGYLIDNAKKCVWDDVNKCQTKQRSCSDYNKGRSNDTPYVCDSFQVDDPTNKKCIYDSEINACKEIYVSCESYNAVVAKESRKENECIEIIPPGDLSSNNNGFKCVFDKDNKECKKAEKECSDFTTNEECKKFKMKDDNKRCVFKSDSCKEEYKTCSVYNTLVSEDKRKKEDCESIVPYYSENALYKCVYSDTNECKEKYISECSEYNGYIQEECNSIKTGNNDYVCGLEKNKCIKQPRLQYNYCIEYDGKEKTICEAIQPWSGPYVIDYGAKCVLNEEMRCTTQEKLCSEAKDDFECRSAVASDTTKKNCVYKNNACVEQYKDCETYQQSETVLDKNTCESIVFASDVYSKCVFTPGTNGQKGTCTKIRTTCSEFKYESYINRCLYLTLGPNSKLSSSENTKCSLSNNSCKTVEKTCKELSFSSKANEEICKNAKTSASNLVCVFNTERNSGCMEKLNDSVREEIIKKVMAEEEEEPTTDVSDNIETTSGNMGSINDEGGNNSGGEKYLNKILLGILCALL